MDADTYTKKIYEKLERDGFVLQKSRIGSVDVIMAAEKKSTLSWLFSCLWARLHFFAFAAPSEHVTREIIESFSKMSFQFAKAASPGLGGFFESSAVSFSLLVSSDVDEEAKDFAQRRPEKHFAAGQMPVIYDLKENELYFYRKTPMWGAMHYKSYRNFIEKYFQV